MKKILLLFVLGASQGIFAQSNSTPVIYLDKFVYQPGESVIVNYRNFPQNRTQWLSYVRKGGDIRAGGGRFDYTDYLSGEDVWRVTAMEPGEYQIVRVEGSYGSGYRVHSVEDFRVGKLANESSFIQWGPKKNAGNATFLENGQSNIYAEDFVFDKRTLVKRIQFHGFVKAPEFSKLFMYIFEDQDGSPKGNINQGWIGKATIDPSSDAVSIHRANNLGGQGDRYYISIDLPKALDKALILEPHNKYWVAIGAATSSREGAWYWQSVAEGKLSSAQLFRNNIWSSVANHLSFSVEGEETHESLSSHELTSADTTNAKIYPNPSEGVFYIKSDKKITTVKVYNAKGQLISAQNGVSVNIEHYPVGVYTFSVSYADGTTDLQKVIKR